jgi:hypothetical protein
MAQASFASPETEAPETTTVSTYVDPTPAASSSDIEIPRLQVVQKMSELDFDAPVGSIVHNKDTVLYRAGAKAPAVILYVQKYWKEDVPFDSDEMPQFAHTQDEANAIIANNGPDGYKVITAANIAVLVAQTEDAEDGSDEAFPFELDGRRYGIGKFTVQKKSYDTTFKAIATFGMFNPKIDPSSIHWNLTSFQVTKGKYSWYVPSLSPLTKEPVGPEVIDFIARLKG